MTVELPTRQEFSEQLNSAFHAKDAKGSECEMVLTDVESHISNDVQENFSLLFRAPVDGPTMQGIYSIGNEATGEHEIFLVPVKQDADALYFEAVFNHLL